MVAITPGTAFTGSPLDVVASGNTLYAVSPSFPTGLDIINVTTGHHTTTILSSPVMDMTVAETGASQVVEPATASLFLSSLAGLIGIRRRCRADSGSARSTPTVEAGCRREV